jgi:hypothetical protein
MFHLTAFVMEVRTLWERATVEVQRESGESVQRESVQIRESTNMALVCPGTSEEHSLNNSSHHAMTPTVQVFTSTVEA